MKPPETELTATRRTTAASAQKPSLLRRVLSGALLLAAAGFLGLLLWLNFRVYAVPHGAAVAGEISADAGVQLANIGRRLREGEGADMQKIFPEGWFFTHALYGMAWVNVGMQTDDGALKRRAAAEVRWVLARLDSPEGLRPFLAHTQVPHGVFYLGWKNRLLGGLLAMKPEPRPTPAETALFHRQCAALAVGFRDRPSWQLDSYPGHAWPCDNVMALASLRLHDVLFEPQFGDVIESWLAFTKEHLDPGTGLIVHKIDGDTGAMLTAARASTQVYILTWLPELDPAFAREQYARFRQLFVQHWLGYLPVREYPIGTSGPADVDTGPIILGICPTATVVSIAAARANGDTELAERSVILSETVGVPWTSGGEKSFAFGTMVVADAFLAWGKTLTLWTPVPETPFPGSTPAWWRWRLHGLSVLVAALVVFAVRRYLRRGRAGPAAVPR